MKKNSTIRILKLSIRTICITYIVLLIYPKILYHNEFTYKSFTVYYDNSTTIDTIKLTSVLNTSIELLQNSELYDSAFHQKIFLCNGFNEFTFFTLFGRKAFGVNSHWTQNIFLSKSSISQNLIYRNDHQYNVRSLSSVIAHETVHSLLRNKLGLIKALLLPKWKNEGYCEYIANEGSFDEKQGLELFCNSKSSDIPAYKYFLFRKSTSYLFKQGITINEFLEKEIDYKNLQKKVREECCNF